MARWVVPAVDVHFAPGHFTPAKMGKFGAKIGKIKAKIGKFGTKMGKFGCEMSGNELSRGEMYVNRPSPPRTIQELYESTE